jgi:large subunit ribosomal protein L28
MGRHCHFLDKTVHIGGTVSRRGKAKYLGGVGRKITGRSRRKFKPNIQRVRAVVDGKVCRIRVSAKAIRMGLLVKPTKRTWKPEPAAEATPA